MVDMGRPEASCFDAVDRDVDPRAAVSYRRSIAPCIRIDIEVGLVHAAEYPTTVQVECQGVTFVAVTPLGVDVRLPVVHPREMPPQGFGS